MDSRAPRRCSLQCRRSCRSSVMGWAYGRPEAGSAPIQQRAGPARLQQAAEQRLINAPTVARSGGARALARLSPGWTWKARVYRRMDRNLQGGAAQVLAREVLPQSNNAGIKRAARYGDGAPKDVLERFLDTVRELVGLGFFVVLDNQLQQDAEAQARAATNAPYPSSCRGAVRGPPGVNCVPALSWAHCWRRRALVAHAQHVWHRCYSADYACSRAPWRTSLRRAA